MTAPLLQKRLAGLLSLLTAAAATGAACPSNADISEALEVESVGYAAQLLRFLEERGHVTVVRFHKSRIVTIVASGKSTAEVGGPSHWSSRGVVKRSRGQGEALRPDEIELTPSFRGPVPLHQLVYRDPCARCGVRADLGCGHSATRLGTEMGL